MSRRVVVSHPPQVGCWSWVEKLLPIFATVIAFIRFVRRRRRRRRATCVCASRLHKKDEKSSVYMVFYINVNLIKLKKPSFWRGGDRRQAARGCIMSWNKSDSLLSARRGRWKFSLDFFFLFFFFGRRTSFPTTSSKTTMVVASGCQMRLISRA